MPSLTIRSRRFADGIDIVGSSLLSLTDHSSLSLTAPPTVVIPNPADPPNPFTYAFLFWNVKGMLTASATTSVADVGATPFNASAWYLQVGGGGGGTPAIGASAFSITQDVVLATTPIQSVAPSSAWPGGSSTVVNTTGGAVTITAKASIGGEDFNGWVLFTAGSAVGPVLSAPVNASGIALAGYLEPARDRPTIPDLELELADIFDRIRGRIKDWVFDPAPIDVLRVTGQFREISRGTAAEVSELTRRLDRLSPQQMQLLHTDLKAQAERLSSALKAVEAAIKAR
jgi:hypothetical protein